MGLASYPDHGVHPAHVYFQPELPVHLMILARKATEPMVALTEELAGG
jgi:hypothetical protein